MKTCPQGHPVPDEASFCPVCGMPVQEAPSYGHTYQQAPQQTVPPYTYAGQGATPYPPPPLTGFRGVIRSPATVILLTVLTCGIYGLYWFYSIAQELNAVLGDQGATNPSYSLWGILCFVFSFILMSQVDEAVMEVDRRRGRYSESRFLIWLLLSLFVGIGFYMMEYDVQTRLNALYEGRY